MAYDLAERFAALQREAQDHGVAAGDFAQCILNVAAFMYASSGAAQPDFIIAAHHAWVSGEAVLATDAPGG